MQSLIGVVTVAINIICAHSWSRCCQWHTCTYVPIYTHEIYGIYVQFSGHFCFSTNMGLTCVVYVVVGLCCGTYMYQHCHWQWSCDASASSHSMELERISWCQCWQGYCDTGSDLKQKWLLIGNHLSDFICDLWRWLAWCSHQCWLHGISIMASLPVSAWQCHWQHRQKHKWLYSITLSYFDMWPV